MFLLFSGFSNTLGIMFGDTLCTQTVILILGLRMFVLLQVKETACMQAFTASFIPL